MFVFPKSSSGELTETTCVNDGDGAHGLNEMLCSKTWSRLGHSRRRKLYILY
ncbi:hypothetical protein J005_06243 [Cryptococcus neoformans]|nr:hypothetical protein C344_06103 [Cryptococcus neoformans var. grubii AD1-7a]OXH23824.1 hypothetical protein J005_06243 [Cryptococcus neoformans var. grubii]